MVVHEALVQRARARRSARQLHTAARKAESRRKRAERADRRRSWSVARRVGRRALLGVGIALALLVVFVLDDIDDLGGIGRGLYRLLIWLVSLLAWLVAVPVAIAELVLWTIGWPPAWLLRRTGCSSWPIDVVLARRGFQSGHYACVSIPRHDGAERFAGSLSEHLRRGGMPDDAVVGSWIAAEHGSL